MSEPLIDVVIPVHDNLPWLRMCLEALRAFTENPTKVILVDNASELPETKKFFDRMIVGSGAKEFERAGLEVAAMRLGANESFSHSVNAGVRLGRAPHVVILNSDALVTKGWDKAFLADLSHDDVGLAGARTAPGTAAGLQAALGPEARVRPAQSTQDNAVVHAGPSLVAAAQGRVCDSPSAPFLIFFAVALRRSTWELVGELDGITCQGWGGGEDLDYSWRVIDHDLRCVISDAYVIHGGSQTYIASGWQAEQKQRAERQNLEALVRKWGEKRVALGLKTQPAVMIAMFHRGEHVLTRWSQCLMAAVMQVQTNGWRILFYTTARTMIDLARDASCRAAIEASDRPWKPGQTDLDYLLMLDDDHTFDPSAFMRLVSSGKPIVGAWAYRRLVNQNDPTRSDHTSCVFRWHDTQDPTKGTVSIEGLEHTGLQRVDAIGFGMVAIRMDVVRAMKAKADADAKAAKGPQWAGTRHKGAIFKFEKFGEDIGFCYEAKQLGFDTWVDTDLVIGHIADPVIVDEQYVQRWRKQVVELGGKR